MSMTGLDSIDRTIHKTNEWLSGVMEHLPTEDRRVAFTAMKAVLHALRDRLPLANAASLSAQLPLLVRGVFFDGWHPEAQGTHVRTLAEFLALVERDFPRTSDLDAEAAARAVFRVMDLHLDPFETEKVIHLLPHPIQDLWRRPPPTRED